MPSTGAETESRDDTDSPVTVVGIGASAGGLEALSQLFRHVPPETGLAYAVVQHLSSSHESILAELLARKAAIPVHQATNGVRVEADCAYVIPPDTEMTLTDGHLKLVPRDHSARPPLPIDAFFRSLAKVQKSRTIGVILSGTGSDGALGMREIKGAGGITFVQDPASAVADGMPRAAIATDCIDVVAMPEEIGAQLARLGQHPYLRLESDLPEEAPATPPPDVSDDRSDTGADPARDAAAPHDESAPDEVSAITGLLRHRFGTDFRLYKPGTIERRIRRRMALRRIDGLTSYADVLRQDGAELASLYGDLLIGVTRFFRDPEVYGVLSEAVIPKALAHRTHNPSGGDAAEQPVRAWVAGCSTGEEVYSIAICLLEFLEDHAPGTRVQIFGTDLSEAAISVARAGVYPHGIEADVSPDRLRRFFTNEEHGYRINKSVRDCCVFARQNLTSDPPFSQMDLVSCRNVLIYLQPGVHGRLMAVFHYALKPGGILVLGPSESASTGNGLFTPINKKHRVYRREPGRPRVLHLDFDRTRAMRPAGSHARADGPPRGAGVATQSTGSDGRSLPAIPDVQRAADQVVLRSYAPAGVVVDDTLQIIQFRGRTGRYIEPAAGSASFHLLKMVRPELTSALRAALDTAREEARPVRAGEVAIHDGAQPGRVTLDVTPFRVAGSSTQFFVVSFEEASSDGAAAIGGPRSTPKSHDESRDETREVGELRQELAAVRRQLQAATEEHASAVEEFQAANEEIQSSNEELQSTNEEIETSKEELQSLNEELTTLNDELRARSAEKSRLNDDLTNLLTSMHVPVIMVGPDLRIRRFTSGAERVVNLIATDIGRPLGDIKSSIDIDNLDALVARVIETLEVTEREVRDLDGRWYRIHIRPYRTSERRIDGAVIVYHDVDPLKRALAQSDAARRYAEAIVQTVREPLVVLDEQFRIVSANRAYYDSFRTSREETLTHTIFEVAFGGWESPALRELLERVRSDGGSFDDFELHHDLPESGRTLLLNARRVTSEHDGRPLVLLAIEDITERKEAAVLLERANRELKSRAEQLELAGDALQAKAAEAVASSRAKSEFLTAMSHELRTPLNAIAGYAQILDLGIHGPVTEAQHNDLARITRSQQHLLGLINEILNYAKLEAGSVSIAWADVNVNDLLESVEAMVVPQISQKGIRWAIEYSDVECRPTLALRGDADKVRQILLNLLTNAVKFTESGGAILVSCASDDDQVAIGVRDTGPGISAEHQAVIFEPFVQVNRSLTRQNDGVGLGLSISRELARTMGGDVTVESDPGQGSTFTLIMPRVSSPADDRSLTDSAATSPSA